MIYSALGRMANCFCCSLRRGGESLCSRLSPAWRGAGCPRVSLSIRGHSGCHLLLGLFSFAGKGLNSLQEENPLATGLVADGGDGERWNNLEGLEAMAVLGISWDICLWFWLSQPATLPKPLKAHQDPKEPPKSTGISWQRGENQAQTEFPKSSE